MFRQTFRHLQLALQHWRKRGNAGGSWSFSDFGQYWSIHAIAAKSLRRIFTVFGIRSATNSNFGFDSNFAII